MATDTHRNWRPSAILAAIVGSGVFAAAQGERPYYDPYAGVDPDGRIQRPELPADLPNPERWRYTPPGRIAPGSVLERFLISSFVTPILFREEDIGFGGGIALTDIDFRNQDYREFANIVLSYSSEGQQAFRMRWARWLHHRKLGDGGIIRDERSRILTGVGYEKTLTRRFFGFGSRTPVSAESSYTEELSSAGVRMRLALPDPGDDLLLQAGMRYQHHGLSRGRVEDLPSTDQAFPATFSSGDDVDQLWLDLNVGWDTRDSLHQPYDGWRLGVGTSAAVAQTGGEVGATLAVDARRFFSLPPLLHGGGDLDEENPPTDVLAFGAFAADTVGDLPYYSLPTLGGSQTLRGYIQNRFTDRSAVHGTVEYRFSLIPRGFAMTDAIRIERVSLGLFYEGGTVANGLEDLLDGEYLDSYGIGLRLGFAREASFRIDLGFSDQDTNLTIAFGNSF